LLEKILSFHSFIHHFEIIPEEKRKNIAWITKHVRGFVREFARCIYRGNETVDCDTCKMHSHLHLPEDIKYYGHPMNWEAGKGERGLKVWAKLASTTAQKINIPIFTHQTALRVADAMLLSKAAAIIREQNNDRISITAKPAGGEDDTSVLSAESNLEQDKKPTKKSIKEDVVLDINVRLVPHYVVNGEGSQQQVEKFTRKGKKGTEGIVPPFEPLVMTALHNAERGKMNRIKIYKYAKLDMQQRGNTLIRASASYDRHGAFFDWVAVNWELKNKRKASAPAKLKLLYEDSNNEMCAIVHCCEWQNEEHWDSDTLLTERWKQEFSYADKEKNFRNAVGAP
jgi:F0F1-type ATP synthase epsilon subunit